MKSYIYISLISIILMQGCSSSPRFTSRDSNSNRYKEEKTRSEEVVPGKIREKERGTAKLETVTGVASFYSDKFHGRSTANGEVYDMHALTAAHESYPFNTIVKVINLKNNKSVTLRINDRKPDFNGRIIDVSYKAAQELGMIINGIAHVRVEVIEWGK